MKKAIKFIPVNALNMFAAVVASDQKFIRICDVFKSPNRNEIAPTDYRFAICG